jgi:guanylate kinase
VAGPSGSGKSHLITAACQMDSRFSRIPSVTTRAARPDERDGIDKVFLSETEFHTRAASGKLICVARNFGALYGHDAEAIATTEARPIVELIASAAKEFVAIFPESRLVLIHPSERRLATEALSRRASDGTSFEARADDTAALVVDDGLVWTELINRYDRDSELAFLTTIQGLVQDA